MATRFRLRETTTAPSVSPALQTYTHNAPTTVRRQLLLTDSSALTNTAYTPDGADHGAAGDSLWCQFVSDEMAAGKVFANGAAISLALQGFEAHANNNLNLQLFVSIVSSDGNTVRRVLRSKVEHATELGTSLASRLLSTTQDGADYTTVTGDRLVVEISVEGTPGGGGGVQGHNGTMRFGADGAGGDITADAETGTTLNPWFEVAPNDLFTAAEEADAEAATGTGAAHAATIALTANAGAATGTGAAHDATVATGRDAPAELASGTGAAHGATITLTTNAEAATGTGAASAAQAAITVNAGAATGTGAAFDATVETSSGTNAPAEVAAGTGAAHAATISLTVNSGAATGTGAAQDAQGGVGPLAGLASGTGAAGAATIALTATAGAASGTGAAYDATIAIGVPAGAATGTGAAYDATVTASGSITEGGTPPQVLNVSPRVPHIGARPGPRFV